LCRDDSRTDNAYPIYQLDEGSSGYVIVIGDNGTLLRSAMIRAAPNSPGNSRKTTARYQALLPVTLMTPEQWEQFPAFAQLPSAKQAFDVVRNRSPLSATKLLGDRAITIDSNSFN